MIFDKVGIDKVGEELVKEITKIAGQSPVPFRKPNTPTGFITANKLKDDYIVMSFTFDRDIPDNKQEAFASKLKGKRVLGYLIDLVNFKKSSVKLHIKRDK